jgi:hypothetical protein
MSKIPNDLLNAMKQSATKTSFDNSFKITDFTPNKKPSRMVKFKKSINSFFSKIKKSKFLLKIKNWYYVNVKKPIKNKKEEKERLTYVKELKENFSKKFNVDVEKTIKIMNQPAYSPYVVDNNAMLVENRLDINKRKSLYKFAPFMYNPEIIEIHNENIDLTKPSLNDIILTENDKSKKELDKQNEFFNKRQHLTVKGRKSNRLF